MKRTVAWLVLTIGLLIIGFPAAANDFKIGGEIRPMLYYNSLVSYAKPDIELYHSSLTLNCDLGDQVTFLTDLRYDIFPDITGSDYPTYVFQEINATLADFLTPQTSLKVGQTKLGFTKARFYLLTEPTVYYEDTVNLAAVLAYQGDWGAASLSAYNRSSSGFKNALVTYETPNLLACESDSLTLFGAYRSSATSSLRNSDIDAALHWTWGNFLFDAEYMARLNNRTYSLGFVGGAYYLTPQLLLNVSYEFFNNYWPERLGFNSGFCYEFRPNTKVVFEYDNFSDTETGRDTQYMLGLIYDF